MLYHVAAAMALVKAFRMHGHLAAHLDPLGSEPLGDPALDPKTLGLTPEIMAAIPSRVLRIAVPGNTLAESLPYLQATYCGTMAYEIEHISTHEERVWLREKIESGAYRKPLSPERQQLLLKRLIEVETLERFLHKAYLGQKRFSIEGVDMLVPMLDLTIESAADSGARDVVIGMAHRGRLNVLAHTIGRPYETIFAEFEGGRQVEAGQLTPEGGTGDVKYHHGAEGAYLTSQGKAITVSLSPNPSHLEYVSPVVDGRARAKQTQRRGREAHHDPTAALPVAIHGDAAFAGQGVVAETLNLGALKGYRTGGTLHLITNNQVGFTTDMEDARSTRYASDLAKGFDIPIIHVNADDAEACLSAVRLAMAYRDRFHQDVVIDLVGYRRYGHNEGDEPAYTQPLMYERIKSLPTVRERYAGELVQAGVITKEESDRQSTQAYQRLVDIQQAFKTSMARAPNQERAVRLSGPGQEVDTALPADFLVALNDQLHSWPEGFHVHPKLRRQLERRRSAHGPRRRHRVGPRRGAGTGVASDRGGAGPVHRSGYRARHLQPASSGAARRGARHHHHPYRQPARRPGPHGAAQQPPLGDGDCGVRVWIQRRGAGGAGAVGGAVRRLRERGSGHHRPVHLGWIGKVGADHPAHPSSAAWLRGTGPGALQRQDGPVPSPRCGGKHPGGQLYHSCPVLPLAPPPGQTLQTASADSVHAQEPAASPPGDLQAGGSHHRTLPAP